MTFPKLFDPVIKNGVYPRWSAIEAIGFDHYLQRELEISPGLLMENAAHCLATLVEHLLPGPTPRLLYLIGPGNNGGDALVCLRQLHPTLTESIYLWAPLGLPDLQAGPAGDATRTLKHLKIPIHATPPSSDTDFNLIIDALFGVGLSRPLSGTAADAVAYCQQRSVPSLAVDCPSGLDATTGAILGTCLAAQFTLSFVGPKAGFYRRKGPEVCGQVHVAQIGVSAKFACEWLELHRNSQKGSSI
ncbi:MAG: NAD(P)H-hydrate epimerase [Planctomycetes bacterium]|nr:NAD(P)H-hydrate epimerase [Planctomycetota bacterium]